MGLFKRKEPTAPQLLTASPADLQRIGRQAFGGESPHPPGAAGLSITEMDGYVLAVMNAGDFTAPGSPDWSARQSRFLAELATAAETAGDWGWVGAFCVAANLVTDKGDHAFLQIQERALTVLRNDGVAYAAVPPDAISHWERIHGYNGGRPAKWPASVSDVPVPEEGEESAVEDLAPGESRRMTQTHPGEASNVIYAEWNADGRVVAMIDGIDQGDGVRKRWEWMMLDRPTYISFLRELGERMVDPPHWAHDDLAPYFPCRPRSRDQMRLAAREMLTGGDG